MAVVIIRDQITKKDIKTASEEYGDYIKIVVDVETGAIAIGGEWHADAEKILLEQDSKQQNLWGGGINMQTKKLDYTALINIRPKDNNNSMEILDTEIKSSFDKIVKEKFDL